MSKKKRRLFECDVVNEAVYVSLTRRRGLGFGIGQEGYLFVQCDQADCQYVDENVPPCPLHLEMFAADIQEDEEKRKRQREAAEHGW